MSQQFPKFEVAEINLFPFLFFSTYQKELEIDWNKRTIKSYSVHETKKRVYDDEKGFFFFDNNQVKNYVPKEETIEYQYKRFFNEQELVLQNESTFEKSNKYLIMFLKMMPLILIALLAFRNPIDFSALMQIAEPQIEFGDIVDISMLTSLPIAMIFVYMGYRFREKKKSMVLFIGITYFSLLILSLNYTSLVHLNRHLLSSIVFLWALFQLYFIYTRGHFDEYYVLPEIRRKKIFFRRRLFGLVGLGDKVSIWKRFSIGGFYMRIVK